MIALLLVPFAMMIAFSGFFEGEVDEIVEDTGIVDLDLEDPMIFDEFETNFGTNNPDTLLGTSQDDALFGLGQKDLIRGFDGGDLIEAGSNNDTVFGGGGDDLIGGGTGADSLFGDLGDDTLIGNAGDDVLVGRAGADVLIGGGGSDSLNGGDGDDVLVSGYIGLAEDSETDVSAVISAVLIEEGIDDPEDFDFDELLESGALNGVNTSFLTEPLTQARGGELFGGAGDDILILSGGDEAEGGSGNDTFVLDEAMVDEPTVVITDYDAADDIIALQYEGDSAPVVNVEDDDEDAIVRIGESLIARVQGGAGLTAANILLFETGTF